jgi:hypothetical protein
VTSRHRLTDSDVEALMSGHTPPDRPDLAATASFLRELPAQLSESEPIELAAPPRRRTRLLVAVAASVAAVIGLAGVVTLRGGDNVVRPALGGAAQDEVTTVAAPLSTTVLPAITSADPGDTNAPSPATTVAPQPGVLVGPVPASPSDSPGATSTSVGTEPDSPVARYTAAVLAWNQCVTVKGEAACGPKPEPAAFGIVTTTSVAPNAAAPAAPAAPNAPGPMTTAPCAGRTDAPPPGLVDPGGLTC